MKKILRTAAALAATAALLSFAACSYEELPEGASFDSYVVQAANANTADEMAELKNEQKFELSSIDSSTAKELIDKYFTGLIGEDEAKFAYTAGSDTYYYKEDGTVTSEKDDAATYDKDEADYKYDEDSNTLTLYNAKALAAYKKAKAAYSKKQVKKAKEEAAEASDSLSEGDDNLDDAEVSEE